MHVCLQVSWIVQKRSGHRGERGNGEDREMGRLSSKTAASERGVRRGNGLVDIAKIPMDDQDQQQQGAQTARASSHQHTARPEALCNSLRFTNRDILQTQGCTARTSPTLDPGQESRYRAASGVAKSLERLAQQGEGKPDTALLGLRTWGVCGTFAPSSWCEVTSRSDSRVVDSGLPLCAGDVGVWAVCGISSGASEPGAQCTPPERRDASSGFVGLGFKRSSVGAETMARTGRIQGQQRFHTCAHSSNESLSGLAGGWEHLRGECVDDCEQGRAAEAS
ncbi:hypothetical protein C8R45DRAFT_1162502 [Mycena sanguinolenta]|nr:hypothetical protein C8R45DRAFT_1162502 [Mycena sanguinolenta]